MEPMRGRERCRAWCPFCYANVRKRANYSGHRGYRKVPRLTWEVEWMALERRARSVKAVVEWSQLCLEQFVFGYPSCLEFLCRPEWDPGVSRVTGTVMLLFDAGAWKLWAHDRDCSEGLFVSGSTLEGAFQALESCLASGTGEWRPHRSNGSVGSKKRS